MHKITVVNQDVVETQNFDSADFESTEHATGKQQNISHGCCPKRKRKVICVTLLIAIVSVIVICILIPTVILNRNETRSITTETAATAATTETTTGTATTTETTAGTATTTGTTTGTATTTGTTTGTATTTGTTTGTATTTGIAPGAATTVTPDPISMAAVDRQVYGVCNTPAGADSVAASAGEWQCHYMVRESPDKACDGNVSTKYLSFGACYNGGKGPTCGMGTGFYLELSRGPTLVNGMKVCTANDFDQRDPIHVSLEGSNLPGRDLSLGSSWTLLYDGSSGLETDPGRKECGPLQLFNNTKEYRSYRFLVSAKRNISYSVQYSEVQLYSLRS
ncbi:unnamed protein product [Adineta ricciae]|uniref:Uncharacterized protein n=1 Tax=Adineta ricciae TaxID=249248 RepID=A0A815R594_ADIRI|nr:unnamed protein product [Adineta ricciae]CAF1471256.1 unnamed protein product [Adineta ricciae]